MQYFRAGIRKESTVYSLRYFHSNKDDEKRFLLMKLSVALVTRHYEIYPSVSHTLFTDV